MFKIEYSNPVVQVSACIVKEREIKIIDDSCFTIIFSNNEEYMQWGSLEDNLVFTTEREAIKCLLVLKEKELRKTQAASSLIQRQIEELNLKMNKLLPK